MERKSLKILKRFIPLAILTPIAILAYYQLILFIGLDVFGWPNRDGMFEFAAMMLTILSAGGMVIIMFIFFEQKDEEEKEIEIDM